MSYDLHLFRASPGGDRLAQGRASLDAGEALGVGPRVGEKEQAKQRLAEALIAWNPELALFSFDYDEIAASDGISVEEARDRWRHLELNGPEDGNGIQITLFDDDASVTVPYWHGREEAERVWAEIWDYLRLLSRIGGFDIYDPQLERILDLETDRSDIVAEYLEGVALVRRVTDEAAGLNRPWWKFW
jgi:hypothetical protein